MVLLGLGFGYLISKKHVGTESVAAGVVRTGNEVGLNDNETFSDSAQGKLEKGGLNGEGTHHLVLDSNPKNSAYLISSVLDLDEFVGKHIEVWGSTQRASKVPWLMDVGRVKMLD